MGTDRYFDFNLFIFVFGIGSFYVIRSGGKGLKIAKNFAKGSLHAGILGFFIALASVPAKQGQALIETIQYAVFSIGLGTIIYLICKVVVNRLGTNP